LADNSLDIITTGDGSFTLFNRELGETYHSVNGAMTESMHVFIQNGLLRYSGEKDDIHILEIGLGTALNALLTYSHIPPGKSVFYTALEPYPISMEIASEYFSRFKVKPGGMDQLDSLLAPGNGRFKNINGHFHFNNSNIPLQSFSEESLAHAYHGTDKQFPGFDIIYFDAFAPQKQPDMWTIASLGNATGLLAANGFLVTYCAQGQFRRDLRSLNLAVQSLQGPPGKREMTLAYK
jgi:tRNA U34 5-methylaminomethyl-2-thiouridine-forming methyltransferase MnmC